MKCEREINQHDTGVGQRKILSPEQDCTVTHFSVTFLQK